MHINSFIVASTGAHNAAALDTVMSQVIYRRAAVEALPKEFLLN